MDSKPDKRPGLSEYGRAVGEFLLEPVTFTRLRHQRLGRFTAEQVIPVGFPIAIGIAAGLNYSPLIGIGAGIGTWLLFAGMGRSIRSAEQNLS